MKKPTKTQLKMRTLGHPLQGPDTDGRCHTCGLSQEESIALHSNEQRGKVLPTKDIPAGDTSVKEATGTMPAGANPASATIKIERVNSKTGKRKPLATGDAQLAEPEDHSVELMIDAAFRRYEGKWNSQFAQKSTPLIFSSINKAMVDIHPLAKTETHPDQGFDFRRIDVILAEIQPILVKHHLFYAPEAILKVEQIDRPVRLASGESWVNIFTRVTVRYRWYCTMDGSSIPVEAVGEGVSEMHYSTASAQTMAEKTMICDLFCIPVYGADDPEEVSVEPSQAVTVTTTVASSEMPTGPAPQSGNLFDLADAPAEGKRRTRRKQEPQTTSVGGAVASEALDAAPAVEKAMDADGPGMIKIIEASMKPKGVTQEQVFAQFGVKTWSEFKIGQVGAIVAWVNSPKDSSPQG